MGVTREVCHRIEPRSGPLGEMLRRHGRTPGEGEGHEEQRQQQFHRRSPAASSTKSLLALETDAVEFVTHFLLVLLRHVHQRLLGQKVNEPHDFLGQARDAGDHAHDVAGADVVCSRRRSSPAGSFPSRATRRRVSRRDAGCGGRGLSGRRACG